MNADSIIEKLLSVRGNKPGKQVDLKEDEIKFLIDKSLPIIKEQKMLVELEAPLHVCGDIHGQYYDLLRIFEHCGYPGEYNYLFLGDYVDRGKQSLFGNNMSSFMLQNKISRESNFIKRESRKFCNE